MFMIMKMWRKIWMSDEKIVQHMIDFIDEKEREIQAKKVANDVQAKNDVVKAILKELERETSDENQ